MKILWAAKKAAGFVAKELVSKACWVWEKRTLFLPSARILKEQRGRMAVAILAVLTIATVLVLVRTVWAADPPTKSASFAEDYIWPLLAYISEWIASLLGQLLLWAIDLLIQVSKYNSFLDANVVSIGWVLVRDVANMFFILIMLVIAFGTMLKIEAYSWKKLLPRLILTALLVNFSKTFIGLLIDFSQVVMLTFVNGYAAAAGGNFMNMFQINKLFSISAGADFSGELMTDDKIAFSAALGFALGAVMLGIALIVVLIFAAILVFRVITLWILIVLSPLAFLLGTFPKGQEYYGQWWKQLQGQIIAGPMVAFFLWLSLAALGGGDINSQIQYQANQTGDLSSIAESAKISTPSEIGKWDNIASFAISIAMLLMSLQMIQQLGVAGAGLASGALSTIKSRATLIAKKLAVPAALGLGVPIAPVAGLGAMYGGVKGARWAAKKGAKYVGEGVWNIAKTKFYDNKTLSRIPAWFVHGSKHREEEVERAREYAAAREKMRHDIKHHGFSPDYERLAKLQREMKKAKDLEVQFDDNQYAALTAGESWVQKFETGEFDPHRAGAHRGASRAVFNAAYIDDMLDGEGDRFDKIRAVLLHDVGVRKADGTIDEEAEETKRMRRTKTTDNYRKLIIRGLTGNTKDVNGVLWRSKQDWENLKNTNPEQYDKDRQSLASWSEGHQAELGLLADMKDVAKKTGHYENMGLASYDSKNKQYTVSTIEDQAGIIATDLAKYGLVEKAKINPHSILQMSGFERDGAYNRPDGMTDLGRLIYGSWMQGMDETNLSRNLLGRTANMMLGIGPKETPLQHIINDKEGGWIQLRDDYVTSENGSKALQTFLSNPLMLRGLFSKVSGVGPAAIGNALDKFKFVVGEGEQAVEVSLKEISNKQGDIRSLVKEKREPEGKKISEQTEKEIEYEHTIRQQEKERNEALARGEPYASPPPPVPERVNEEEAIDTGLNELMADIAEKGAATALPGADVAGAQAAVDAIRAAGDEAAKALEGVVKQLAGLKNIDRINEVLNRAKSAARDGQPTLSANVAYLLQQLIGKEDQIKQILLRLEPKPVFKKKEKK